MSEATAAPPTTTPAAPAARSWRSVLTALELDTRLLGDAAGKAAVQLCQSPDVSKVSGTAPFKSPGGNTITSILLQPQPITKDNLNVVLDAGWIDKATLCKDVQAASAPAACK